MKHNILIIILLCVIILISGCTSTDSTNSSINNTTSTHNISKVNLDSRNTSNSIPLKMNPGQRYNVSITMKNTGSIPWSSNNITLCLANDSSNEATLFNNNTTRYFMKPKTVTNSGYNYTWNITIIAPTYPNIYSLIFQMMDNNTTWFGDKLAVNITDGKYTGPVTFISNTIPTTMRNGTNYTASVVVQNTGKQPWLADNRVALAAVDYESNNVSWFLTNQRYYLNPGTVVAPGQKCQWKFWIIAPKYTGTYLLKYRMVEGNESWFGNMTTVTIKVT